MDCVLRSQFLGKFRNLRDADNTLSENINQVFERDGIISEKTIGVPTNLDERQANDLQDWFCLLENSSVSSFRCMNSILSFMEDDIFYHLKDYVFSEQCTKLAKIIDLYRINAEEWVDLEIMEDLNIDSESKICFASIGSDRFKKMVKMSMISYPVVTAVENNCIWFVSHRMKSTLPWISHHLTL